MEHRDIDKNNLKIASLKKRTTAYFIDDIVVSLLIFIIFYEQLTSIYISMDSSDITPLIAFLEGNTLIFILLRVIYQTFFVWQSEHAREREKERQQTKQTEKKKKERRKNRK